MHTTNHKKFKGEIEGYLAKAVNIFESRIDRAFAILNFKTQLNRVKIRKKDGYHASHLLFILTLLPLFKIPTVHSFCQKQWYHWCIAQKDAFYRFKQASSRWRSFMYKVIITLSEMLNFEKYPLQERYLILDDSPMAKRGRKIENISFIYDSNLRHSVLGFCIVTLGLFTEHNFYPLDFSYWFSNKRHPKSPQERIGDPRSISGQMSYEAKHLGKPELALKMIQRAFDHGIRAGYVLFDSWYAWPSFINAIRKIDSAMHVVCRLKDTKVLYEYKGKKYRLSELYQKVKSNIYGGKYPLSLPSVYSASKAGLIGLSRYLATYLADRNIRVNCLVPGGVYDKQDEKFYREYVKRVPLKRMASWTDFNGAILFLSSEASRYMTGQILVIDGGWSVW